MVPSFDLLFTALVSAMLVVGGALSVALLPWRAEEVRATRGAAGAVLGWLRVQLMVAVAPSRPVVEPFPASVPGPSRAAA